MRFIEERLAVHVLFLLWQAHGGGGSRGLVGGRCEATLMELVVRAPRTRVDNSQINVDGNTWGRLSNSL